MKKVIVDSAFQAKLNGTDAELEFVDPAGKTVGFFLPADEHERLKQIEADYQRYWCKWGLSKLTEEEIARSAQDNVLYTTEEVIAHLERL
jgi:hypothetical protein